MPRSRAVSRQRTYYRYRTFSTAALSELCEDQLYFANPGTFNDPLDCYPTLTCDSPVQELRALVDKLVRQRVAEETRSALLAARIKGRSAEKHAMQRAAVQAGYTLREIAYQATNPDHEMTVEEAECWLLMVQAERELLTHYARGVCCFSVTAVSPLLWSHYGDQHRGICVGYGTAREPQPQLQEVNYQERRAVKTSLLVETFVKNNAFARRALDIAVLLRKARGWRYEREWRLVGTAGLQNSPMLLKEVIFGLKCPRSVIFAVTQSLANRRQPMRFYEIYTSRADFRLRRREVDLDALNSVYPREAYSAEEEFDPVEPDQQQ